MGLQMFPPNTSLSSVESVDQQQMTGLIYGSLNISQQQNGLSNNLELLHEDQQNHHQRKLQTLCSFEAEDQGGLKKLDSFGRWMSREFGGDAVDSLVASDSGMYWNTLDGQDGVENVSSFRQIQLETDLLCPSLSQDQLFIISNFSPDWAYTTVDTKVLITGMFMGGTKDLFKYKLSCMFGEIEVPADVLGLGILRCQAPPLSPGRVPFYVTCSNRLACSEVWEFEYRAGPSQDMIASSNTDIEAANELFLQIRFAKLLTLKFDKVQTCSSIDEDESCNIRNKLHSLIKDSKEEWKEMERTIKESAPRCDKTHSQLIQNLLKEKLYTWLLSKTNDEGKGPSVLDDKGQGAMHLAAALGYDWAMGRIVSAGVNINFRDLHGWTALHWAAFYGRELTVSTLIKLKAAPGVLTDPTPKFPAGRTPADLASSRGHKGIAGYLAESALASHLSNLSIYENIIGSVSATLAGETAVESVLERGVFQLDGGREDQLSLKDSLLAAVRNAAQAACRIQSAFRMYSFRRSQMVKNGDDKCGISDEKALSYISVQRKSKLGNHDQALHMAAVRIQRKFRGWKGRKEFLNNRQRIAKIQAHIRGHQARKNYRKIIWSVGILEKAILQWRRKGVRLRGFRAEGATEGSDKQNGEYNDNDDYDFLRAGRKQVEVSVKKALEYVLSMVQYPEARD